MVLGLAVAKFGSSNIAYALAAGSILLAVADAGPWFATLRYVMINREIAQERFTTGSSVHGPIIVAMAMIFACAIVVAASTPTMPIPHQARARRTRRRPTE